MRTTKSPRTERIHLVVTAAVRERIERLVTRTEAASLTEVICRALLVYEESLSPPVPDAVEPSLPEVD